MDRNECAKLYEGMDQARRCRFLVRVSSWLTVAARGTYEAGTKKILEPEKLRGFNEILHLILSKLRAVLDEDPSSYPDDLFWQIVYRKAEDWELLSDLSWSLDQAIERLRSE